MKLGRPNKSIVRDRLVEILYLVPKETSYNLHKIYVKIFGNSSQRNIYYQLQKGVALDLFQVEDIVDEKGNFSWGEIARKKYYKLSKNAKPILDEKVCEYFKGGKK